MVHSDTLIEEVKDILDETPVRQGNRNNHVTQILTVRFGGSEVVISSAP